MKKGKYGKVVEVSVLNRKGVEKEEREMDIEREEIESMEKESEEEKDIMERKVYGSIEEMIDGKVDDEGKKGLKKGKKIKREMMKEYKRQKWWKFEVEDEKMKGEMEEIRRK